MSHGLSHRPSVDRAQPGLRRLRQRRDVQAAPLGGIARLDAETAGDRDDADPAPRRIDAAAAVIGDVDLLLRGLGPVDAVLLEQRVIHRVGARQARGMRLGGDGARVGNRRLS